MSEKDDPKDDGYYKCIKLPLNYILKNSDINLPKITDAVIRSNDIVVHTLLFMKLYLLKEYDDNKKIPEINKELINSIMKILCNESTNGRPSKKEIQQLKSKLTKFYDEHYKSLVNSEKLDYKYLNTVLDYLTIDILTMYENNIKLHYVEYVERYVNVVWKKKFMIDKIRKIYKTKKERENRINKLCQELRKIKTDLLNVEDENYKSKKFYHDWIKKQKKDILPNKTKYDKNSLYYDLQCNPQDYLVCMIKMMKEIEKEKVMIYNIFPMRNEICPKHVRLDTTTLVHLLFTKKQGNKTDYLTQGNLKRHENKIWNFFFRTERKQLQNKRYTFNNMIETDGVSCSILMLRNDMIGKKFKPKLKLNSEKYIDELKNYKELKNKNIVAIDPGVNSIITCVNGTDNEATKFRYTQDQRRNETKSKKYSKIILEMKKEKIDNKTIIDYETELSKLNKKTLNINEFKKYISKKIEVNNKLKQFYKKYIFRKLKLNGYINRKKSEQKLMRNFENIFGSSRDTIVCIGDYEQKQHMKYKEPTKGKSIRSLFRKNNYQVYLVDEFRTSCRCCECETGECKKETVRKNPRPFKDGSILVHALLCCKNINCGVWWNRDINGAKNIYKIVENCIKGKERPKYLSREKSQTLFTKVLKPKLTRDAKTKPCS